MERSPPAGRSTEAPNTGRQHSASGQDGRSAGRSSRSHAKPKRSAQHMAEGRRSQSPHRPGPEYRRQVGLDVKGQPQPARPRPSRAPDQYEKWRGIQARSVSPRLESTDSASIPRYCMLPVTGRTRRGTSVAAHCDTEDQTVAACGQPIPVSLGRVRTTDSVPLREATISKEGHVQLPYPGYIWPEERPTTSYVRTYQAAAGGSARTEETPEQSRLATVQERIRFKWLYLTGRKEKP
jgi:hypothetical protein